jgi:hypothetical protein
MGDAEKLTACLETSTTTVIEVPKDKKQSQDFHLKM